MLDRIIMRLIKKLNVTIVTGILMTTASYYLLTKRRSETPLERIDFSVKYTGINRKMFTESHQYEELKNQTPQDNEDSIVIYNLLDTTNLTSNLTLSNETFLMPQESEHLFDLAQLGKLLELPWTKNTTNKEKLFANDFSQVLDFRFQFATKNNTGRKDAVRFIHTRNRAVLLPSDMYRALPNEYPFGEKKFNTCSVVGSSGILKNSCCGSQIDSADFVIRFNMPPLKDFIKDAGRVSNITTVNPSQIEITFNSLKSKENRDEFMKYIKQYENYLWVSGFGLPSGLYLTRRVLRTIRSTPGKHVKVLLGHPTQWQAMNKFWSKRGVNASRISSGAYWLSSALTMCDNVHLYGFWPFSTDHHGKPIHYHYYEDIAPVKKILKYHHFDQEFQAIVDLHTSGILQLHVDNCKC